MNFETGRLHFLRNVIAPVVVIRRCFKSPSIIIVVVLECRSC